MSERAAAPGGRSRRRTRHPAPPRSPTRCRSRCCPSTASRSSTLTESLAAETEPHGVCVFAVTPGYVPTAMIEYMVESPEGRRWLPHVRDGKPVDPSLVVDLVAFLSSGAADGLNGRFLRALDDAPGLARRADAIRDAELYVVRLRRE